ncbi:Sex-determining transformer 1 [Fusarium pseudoanthophilum]|uniref:Sex-determining transformer 1 n=1 Tax=Fusarium pseudoanthophilum TaxID=48495 RepID=A0A8H5PBQ3_9HYPO|nr:Sex-determining transformer 1 [Fusarium pseudoanthophilum]
MDSFSPSQEQRGGANVSPQAAAQQQSSNLAALGQQRHQTANPFWQNWAGDDPWNPLAFGAPNDGQTRSQLIGSANFQTSYQDYRSKPLLSECDTNPEDSAYGSRLTHSIGNPSAYGEDMDPDVQNLEPQNSDAQLVNRNLETLQLQCQPASNDAHLYQDQWVRPYPPASVATAPVGGERRWICGDCQKRCRTRSELRKHELKHSLPWHCDVTGCSREKGFTSKNDLDRHKRTVHSDRTVSGLPSQDLEGVGGSAMAYLQAQEQLPGLAHPSTILSFRVSYGERRASQPQSVTSHPPRGPPSLSFDRDASSLATVREGDESFAQPDIVHGRSALPPNQWPASASEEDAPGDDVTASEAEQPDDDALETMDGVQQVEGTTTDVSRDNGDPGSQQADVRMVDADEAQRTPKAIPPHEKESETPADLSPESAYDDLLDKIPKELIASYLKKKRFAGLGEEASKPDTVSSKNQTHPHKCQECDKAFPRLCELKKHQKRHSKPYGCTFADCKKTFGSKNDWKRHESIQHYQLETWICDCAKSDSAEPCGKVCYRRESFRNHLSKEHEITDTSKLEEKVEGCRKGRHCDAHFWCGFCRETVEIKETDNTWAKRCDHIDDHFSGRRVPKRDIREWIHEKDHSIVPSAPQMDESGSSSESSPCDPISPQSTVSTENSGEDRRGRKKDMYMWTCCNCAVENSFSNNTLCCECNQRSCKNCTWHAIPSTSDT